MRMGIEFVVRETTGLLLLRPFFLGRTPGFAFLAIVADGRPAVAAATIARGEGRGKATVEWINAPT